jgi:hypothetical protein
MDLVLVACLAISPASCREERVPDFLHEPAPEALCARAAVATVAEWAGDHPDLTVERWRCERRRG